MPSKLIYVGYNEYYYYTVYLKNFESNKKVEDIGTIVTYDTTYKLSR